MKEREERLPENHFFRIHCSFIVNIQHVLKIEKWFNYSYRFHMKGVEALFRLSRSCAKKFKDKFS